MLRDTGLEMSVTKRNSPVRTTCCNAIGYYKLMDLFISSGTRAPGSSDGPNDPDNDHDDNVYHYNNGGMSVGAIAGIVIGVIPAIAVVVIIVVKCSNRERVPMNQPVQPVPAPPAVVSYNEPTPAYPRYGPMPRVPVHSLRIDVEPPSYEQAMSSTVQVPAPPYNPYYKGVSAF